MIDHFLIFASSLAAIAAIVPVAQARSAEKSVPLLTAADMLAADGTGLTQGATTSSAGSILYPDQILTIDVPIVGDATHPVDPQISEWSKAYRFIVIPINLAIQTPPGKAPRSVVINAGFRNLGQLPKQPIIIDQFPATGFKAEPFSGSVSIGIGGDLKYAGTAPANAEASVKAALNYTYAPAFANVQSGFASSSSYWTFVATQDKQPVGSLPLKLTVGIPRKITAASWSLAIDVVAAFGSTWWGDEVRATFVTEVRLPP